MFFSCSPRFQSGGLVLEAPLNPPQGGTFEESFNSNFSHSHGAIIRGDSIQKRIAIVFTGDEYGEGGNEIANTLEKEKVKASFFLTGRFYRNPAFKTIIARLKKYGHYLGAHSDNHLLYCDWTKRDSMLVEKKQFQKDLLKTLQLLYWPGNAGHYIPGI